MQKVESMEKKLLKVLSNKGSGCYNDVMENICSTEISFKDFRRYF